MILGDAGHISLPIGGQGMNTALQDAFNLGWKPAYVLKGWAAPELLNSYSPERYAVRDKLHNDQVSGFYKLMYPGDIQKFVLRNFGSFLLKTGSELYSRSQGELTQLALAYPESPITQDEMGKNGLKAGDRAPNAAVVDSVTLPPLCYPCLPW